jgi:N-acetylneuraminate synthase
MDSAVINLGQVPIGAGHPVYVIAEIGINHNGSLECAKQLIAGAKKAGANAVKFQKRTPELCVPKEQWYIERDTPWGRLSYIEYRRKVEFGQADYAEIDRYCRELDIAWTASCWDEPSVDFVSRFQPPFLKAASASLTDLPLLHKMRDSGIPVMISTGMSTITEVESAVDELIGARDSANPGLLIAHATSTYPCQLDELNLRVILSLKAKYPTIPIGYSGHETGLAPTLAAVALGATFIERHITLDRAMWGTDQAASVELGGFERLVNNIRNIESALGDGVKRLYPSEITSREKLRRVQNPRLSIAV